MKTIKELQDIRSMRGDSLCLCGCGGTPKRHTSTSARMGRKIGEPRFFIQGHNHKSGLCARGHEAGHSFVSAKQRCTNPNVKCYGKYGGRGIEFRFSSFEEFVKCVGPRPSEKHSVDRINTDGHYEPGNVRWATQAEQVQNSSKAKITMEDANNIRMLYLAGYRQIEISDFFGISQSGVSRIVRMDGWL